jgi:hypothetical protein
MVFEPKYRFLGLFPDHVTEQERRETGVPSASSVLIRYNVVDFEFVSAFRIQVYCIQSNPWLPIISTPV